MTRYLFYWNRALSLRAASLRKDVWGNQEEPLLQWIPQQRMQKKKEGSASSEVPTQSAVNESEALPRMTSFILFDEPPH